MKHVLAIMASLFAPIASAHHPALYPESYPTFNEAATRAVAAAYAAGYAYEFGGVILQTGEHTFRVSLPDTDLSGDSVLIEHDSDWPDMRIVADYHTHPCFPYTHYPDVFSPTDVKSNQATGYIGVMGDLCTGKVHEFDPATMRYDDVHFRDDYYGTRGKIVGQIPLYQLPIVLEKPDNFVEQLTKALSGNE